MAGIWETVLSAALPALVQGGASYFSNAGQASAADRTARENRDFTSQQNALQRQFEMEKLQMQLAAQAANAGGGNEAAMAAVKQRAYEAAIDAMLRGAQNQHTAAQGLVQGMQAPYLGR